MRSILVLTIFLFNVSIANVSAQTPEPAAPEEEETGSADFVDPFEEEGMETEISDPLQPLNRGIFWVNDRLYFYLLKPVARAYRVAPEPFRKSVGNFFSNLATPVRLANSVLQFKFAAGGNELRRFLLNSTIGVAGLFDPAKKLGWPTANEDFGQTLGLYGVGSGIYLVLPLFGPANLRDGAGRVGDAFLDPILWATDGTGEVIAVKGYDQINTLSLDDDTYEKIKEEALDPYLFIRDAYQQRREALIRK
jgi:phospholipid-binding lipoprotein MlaA